MEIKQGIEPTEAATDLQQAWQPGGARLETLT